MKGNVTVYNLLVLYSVFYRKTPLNVTSCRTLRRVECNLRFVSHLTHHDSLDPTEASWIRRRVLLLVLLRAVSVLRGLLIQGRFGVVLKTISTDKNRFRGVVSGRLLEIRPPRVRALYVYDKM